MTTRVRAAATEPRSSLAQPAGTKDLLDYQLYSLYRDCGYVFEQLCQVEFGVTRRRWRILRGRNLYQASSTTAEPITPRPILTAG
jgi:hypothetical protein